MNNFQKKYELVLLLTVILFAVGSAAFSLGSNVTAIKAFQSADANTTYLPVTRGGSQTGGSCASGYHDPTKWHPLIDPEAGCHYNHEHKHNPREVDDIFGEPGAWFGNPGQEISYPWQTFTGAGEGYPQWSGDPDELENVAKHNVYGWIVRRDIPADGRSTWIKAFRLQYHAMSAPPGTLTRYHSFSLEAQVCGQSGQCGLVRTGGWIDYGNLQVSGHGTVLLPDHGQPIDFNDDARRRIHFFYSDPDQRAGEQRKAEFFWYGRHAPPPGVFPGIPAKGLDPVVIALATSDAWSNVAPENPEDTNFFCPDYHCNKNGSTIQAHVVQFSVPEFFDDNSDGIVNFTGHTDRYGMLAEDCRGADLDCVPLIVEHAPEGRVQHRDDTHLGLDSFGAQDFDTSPPGEWWIEYPN